MEDIIETTEGHVLADQDETRRLAGGSQDRADVRMGEYPEQNVEYLNK